MNISTRLKNFFRRLHMLATQMPGTIVFQPGMSEEMADGCILIAGENGSKSVRVPFRCENNSGARAHLSYVQEEIVVQARMCGYEPIYLMLYSGNGKGVFERTIHPEFGDTGSA